MVSKKGKFFTEIKEKIFLIKSLELTSTESFNLFINNFIIFNLTRIYYLFRSLLYFRSPKCIYNYQKYLDKKNKTDSKRALLSFLRYPVYKEHYIGQLKFFFSTHGLVLNLLRALNELGYSIDIIDFYNKKFIPKRKYDIFVVHTAQNFKNIYQKINKDAIKICFDTGSYWRVHNQKEEERFNNLKQRKGSDLPFDRYIYNGEEADYMLSCVDGIISLGSNFTRESYSETPFTKKLFTLNNAFYKDKYYRGSNKNYSEARKNFIFFSGGGNIHKGLDLLLEVFAETDLHLYICTDFDPGFEEVYKKELTRPNIHHVGYLKQRTKKFYDVINKCAFNVHPSCSEGSPGGVIDLMQYGIIPILSRESNIDGRSWYFILLDNCNVETISKAIEKASKEPSELLKKKSLLTRQNVFANFSEENFLKNIKNYIKRIIDSMNKG